MEPAVLDAATLEKLISAAVAAPSMLHTQPWRYRLNPDTLTLEVRAAPERGLRQADPMGRALCVSAGAAVCNLRVAVAHFGWEPVVRLLPHRSQPDLLATVRLTMIPRGGAPNPVGLYDMIWRRPGSRYPYPGRRLPPRELGAFAEAARGDGATLYPAGPEETARLLRLTAEAERRGAEGHRGRGATDGRGRDGGPEGRPTIAVLTTAHDRRADWLRAGQALGHILLLATAHGVRATLLHQALEWSDLRWALSDGRRAPGHVQMLIRLGPNMDGQESGPEGVPGTGVSGAGAGRPTPAGFRRPGAR
ncbi:hypothetical protein ACH4TX_14160 [Streptomyces sp. NPDC021098]|uniref:hypothetical protein n=1 Tax=unclassified Streptomyces TaxID=2593676 RepID=UPI0037963733